MRTGQTDLEEDAISNGIPQVADDAAMQAALILGSASRLPAVQPHPAPSIQQGDLIIAQPPIRLPQAISDFVPLDDRWHRENGPSRDTHQPQRQQAIASNVTTPKPSRAAAPAISRPAPVPAIKTVVPQREPTVVVTPASEEDYYEEVEHDADGTPDIRIHTPMSKFFSTILNIGLFIFAFRVVWTTGARYTVAAVLGLDPMFDMFKINIQDWHTQPFFIFEGIAAIFGWIPLIGELFQPLATLPKIWLFPIFITIGESVFWPRRRRMSKDLLYFWRPLKGEANWKHYTFLTFLAFDVVSTCVGAIMDRTIPGGVDQITKNPGTTFDWGVILNATRGQVFLGICLGIFCAVISERLASFTVRDTIGLWFRPNHWVHRLFRPSGYVQYK